jgi:hypothetical protein
MAVAGLSVMLLGLGGLAFWQQIQLQKYSREGASGATVPARPPVIRRLNGPRIVVAPLRARRAFAPQRFAGRPADPGYDRAAVNPGLGAPPQTLMEDPEFQRAFELYREGMLDARYATLFRQLNLAPDELAAFKHLLAEKDNMALDVVAISQASGGPVAPDLVQAGVQEARGELENSIRAELGTERYDEYREYEDTMAQRATVLQLERRLSYSDSPLTQGQEDKLVKILSANSPPDSSGKAPAISLVVGADQSGVLPIVNPDATGLVTDAAIAEAKGTLSPQQVAALRQLQVEQQAIIEASRLILDGSPGFQLPQTDWGLLLQ